MIYSKDSVSLSNSSLTSSSANPQTFYPIPTKPIPFLSYQYNSSSSLNNSNDYLVPEKKNTPSLEDIVDDCFKLKNIYNEDRMMNNYDISPNFETYVQRKSVAESFLNYTYKLHCNENLQFLIEIYKYEYLYYKLFPNNLHKVFKNLNLNSSSPLSQSVKSNDFLSKSLDDLNLIFPINIRSDNKMSSDSPVSTSSHNQLINSDVNQETAYNISLPKICNNDYNCEYSTSSPGQDNQDTTLIQETNLGMLKDKKVSVDHLSASSEVQDIDQLDENEKHLRELQLKSQWDSILENYLLANSPYQINLSNKSNKKIMNENTIETFHNPDIFQGAKNEIFQLIRENAYISFLHELTKKSYEEKECRETKEPEVILPERQKSPRLITSSTVPPKDISPKEDKSENKTEKSGSLLKSLNSLRNSPLLKPGSLNINNNTGVSNNSSNSNIYNTNFVNEEKKKTHDYRRKSHSPSPSTIIPPLPISSFANSSSANSSVLLSVPFTSVSQPHSPSTSTFSNLIGHLKTQTTTGNTSSIATSPDYNSYGSYNQSNDHQHHHSMRGPCGIVINELPPTPADERKKFMKVKWRSHKDKSDKDAAL